MADEAQIFWVGQTQDQVLGIADGDNKRLCSVLVNLPGLPANVRAEFGYNPLCIANTEPLEATAKRIPEFWAPPASVAEAARRFAEAVAACDAHVEEFAHSFCRQYGGTSFSRFFQAIFSGPGTSAERVHRAAAILMGDVDPLCRRQFVAALEEFAGYALMAEAFGAEMITVDLGVEGYWAVDGPEAE